jgi:hypothetical protein
VCFGFPYPNTIYNDSPQSPEKCQEHYTPQKLRGFLLNFPRKKQGGQKLEGGVCETSLGKNIGILELRVIPDLF